MSQGVHAGENGPAIVFGRKNLDYQPHRSASGGAVSRYATAEGAKGDLGDTKESLAHIADNLDEYLSLDSNALSVHPDGTVDENWDEYIPEQGSYGHIDDYIKGLQDNGWTPIEITGAEGGGVIAHPSEYLSGTSLAYDIVSTPGTYATVSVWDYGDDDSDDIDIDIDSDDDYDSEYDEYDYDPEPIGWMLIKKNS